MLRLQKEKELLENEKKQEGEKFQDIESLEHEE